MNDLKFAVRQLLKNPGFTAVAVLTLAFGIGANTAIFTLIDAVLLKMLPVKDPEQLVVLAAATAGKKPQTIFSYPMFQHLREGDSVFSGMFAYCGAHLNLSVGGTTQRIVGELVSGNFFSVLGLTPFRGRLFSDEDDQAPGAHPVAVVSYNFWKNRLAEDPTWLGKTIHLNGYPFTLVGVAPPSFFGVEVGSTRDVWVPMMMQAQMLPGTSRLEDPHAWWLSIMSRLKPGVTERQAQASTDILFQHINQEAFANPKDQFLLDRRIQLLPGSKGLSRLREQFSRPLLILMITAGVVLLIACANIANLLLARAAARQQEIVMRLSLGAGRLRLIRQLLTESLLLSLLGGLLGLILAFRGTDFLLGCLPQRFIPAGIELHPDWLVLGFTLGLSLLSGVLFGLMPALQAARSNLTPALRNEVSVQVGGFRPFRLRKMLVITQVALSLALLIGAGLFVRTLQNLKRLDVGFNPEKVLLFSMNPGLNGYDTNQVKSFYGLLISRVQMLPGVQSASFAGNALLSGDFSADALAVEGYQPRPKEDMSTLVNFVEPRFFETIGMFLRLGRDFAPQDDERGPKVAVINETFARDFFGQENPIGRRIGVGKKMADTEIVGVIRDTKYRNLREQPPRTVYLPFQQSRRPSAERTLYVRTAIDPNNMVATVRREVQALDRDLPLYNVMTMTKQVDQSLVQERLVAQLSSAFGGLALLLACVGLYGLMTYTVMGRTREIGIRMALGAARGHVLWLILKDTLWLMGVGLGVGLALTFALTRWVSSLLYGITGTDPVIFSSVSLLLLTVALLATWLPAQRAAKIEPMEALRYE